MAIPKRIIALAAIAIVALVVALAAALTLRAEATTRAAAAKFQFTAAFEALAKSAHEIGRQVSRSTTISNVATAQAEEAVQLAEGLVGTAHHITEVVVLIQDIADQTNMLAFNALMEAARAVKNVANSIESVSSTIVGVAQATHETARMFGEIERAARGIEREISAPRDRTTRFVAALNRTAA